MIEIGVHLTTFEVSFDFGIFLRVGSNVIS